MMINDQRYSRTMVHGEIILCGTEDGVARIHIHTVNGTVWLTQSEIAELFDTSEQNINLHIKNALTEMESTQYSVVKEYLTTDADGKSCMTKFYNLDVILAVGYRIQTPRGAQFRKWATIILEDFAIKGFSVNDEVLKNPDWDYFDELLERIREIRASEARFYRKVRDILALCEDYDHASNTLDTFYAKIQNKMLHAVTGKTAAELIVSRANPELPNMGLISWKGSRVRKGDVTTPRNFLSAEEISGLNLIVTMFLDTAELRVTHRQTTKLAMWEKVLDTFIANNELHELRDAGRISAEYAKQVAELHYMSYDQQRKESERLSDVNDEDLEELKRIAEQAQQKNQKATDA